MIDKRELVEKLQELTSSYRIQADEYVGPAKGFYLGKCVALMEVLIWIIDDDDLSYNMLQRQVAIFESVIEAENAFVEMGKIAES